MIDGRGAYASESVESKSTSGPRTEDTTPTSRGVPRAGQISASFSKVGFSLAGAQISARPATCLPARYAHRLPNSLARVACAHRSFARAAQSNENISPAVVLAVAKELRKLTTEPLDGIKVIFNDEDVTDVNAEIKGPGAPRRLRRPPVSTSRQPMACRETSVHTPHG